MKYNPDDYELVKRHGNFLVTRTKGKELYQIWHAGDAFEFTERTSKKAIQAALVLLQKREQEMLAEWRRASGQ